MTTGGRRRHNPRRNPHPESDALLDGSNTLRMTGFRGLSCALVGKVVPRLVHSRAVRMFVLVIELFLQLALFLGCLLSVLGPSGRVGADLLIHRDLL